MIDEGKLQQWANLSSGNALWHGRMRCASCCWRTLYIRTVLTRSQYSAKPMAKRTNGGAIAILASALARSLGNLRCQRARLPPSEMNEYSCIPTLSTIITNHKLPQSRGHKGKRKNQLKLSRRMLALTTSSPAMKARCQRVSFAKFASCPTTH